MHRSEIEAIEIDDFLSAVYTSAINFYFTCL